jgi:hypothetical protein
VAFEAADSLDRRVAVETANSCDRVWYFGVNELLFAQDHARDESAVVDPVEGRRDNVEPTDFATAGRAIAGIATYPEWRPDRSRG